MSTSTWYHTFGVRGYHYIRTEYENGATIFHLKKAGRNNDVWTANPER